MSGSPMKFSRLIFPETRAALACTLTAATLAACGGGSSTSDPLQKYREQSVQWTACDPTILGTTSEKLDALWQQLGDRLSCGLVKAPLDWANPERGDVAISAMRVAAGAPEKKRGALLFNPGGPGIDGLGLTFNLLTAFADSNPDSAQGAMQLRLLAEYDMVGFSPRGTGASTRLQCATNELQRFVDMSAAGYTPDNVANAEYNATKTVQACQKNPITPFINTDATARDLDLLRSLLGEDKLNYLGYSYGTWLGAWYANLFPERVGRMVLDSSQNFFSTHEDMSFAMPWARQRVLDEVLVPYAVRHADYFQLGATQAEVRAVIPQMSPQMQHVLGSPLSRLGYNQSDADKYLMTIAAARGVDAVLQSVADLQDQEAVEQTLAQHVFHPVDTGRDAAVREIAQDLLNDYAASWIVKPQPKNIALDYGDAVLEAVRCNDTPATTDPATRAALAQDLRRRAPMFYGIVYQDTCAFWGGPRVSKPDPAAMQPLPVLLVQSQYDSATYTEGANAFFAQLPQASRVYVPGDYQHGVYPYKDSCVDSTVTRYLLGESPAQRETFCPAQPLQQDKPAEAQTVTPKSTRGAGPSTYKNPAQAHEQIDKFKRGLIPSNPRR